VTTPVSRTAPGAVRGENLALIFQEVLTVIVRIRSNRQELSDAESFRYYVQEALRSAIQQAKNQAGYSAEDIRMATLALVGLLDESVLNARNPLFANWPRKTLQEELFGIHMAGELFFQNLEQLLNRADSADLADVLEVHYLCLLLGYGGRYSTGGRAELKAIMETVADRIRRIRGPSEDPFLAGIPAVTAGASGRDPWVKGLFIGAAACFVMMLVFLVLFKLTLGSGASALQSIASQAAGGQQ
jgi:type VI secretion system protein ImpK